MGVCVNQVVLEGGSSRLDGVQAIRSRKAIQVDQRCYKGTARLGGEMIASLIKCSRARTALQLDRSALVKEVAWCLADQVKAIEPGGDTSRRRGI